MHVQIIFLGEEETDHLSQLLQCNDAYLKQLIKTHHPLIVKYIKFSCLIKFFNEYEIFTNDEMFCFQSNLISDEQKTNSLVEWLQKKDKNGVHNFLRSLHKAKVHSGHSAILQEMHTKLNCNT